ncbi:MAG: carboxypeptidase [Methylococcaceae bacterium]|nr:carboxypeptidase [Methylococcaceae bacterium]
MSFLTRRSLPKALIIFTLILIAAVIYGIQQEILTSKLQARYFSGLGEELHYAVNPGSSSLIRYPTYGPYDVRLGYVGLPNFIARLQKQNFAVTAQSRISPLQAKLSDLGLYSVYHEKERAGLRILDDKNQLLFESIYPKQVYPSLESIPPLVLNTLLYIENRKLLDEHYAHLNPAVEWTRFGKATLDVLKKSLGVDINAAGGSTLATQLEKYQHSPGGITTSVFEKLRQMSSASLRAYLDGTDTLPARRQIALNYLNSVPLAAANGYGEVQGVGEGMRIWYQADFETANRLLAAATLAQKSTVSLEQGRAYRQFLSLLLAQRRPTYMLGSGHESLQKLADSHLRLLAADGIISPAMRDAALANSLELNRARVPSGVKNYADHKTQTMVRARLAANLGVKSLYDLDRLDLSVKTSLNQSAQREITAKLIGLRQPVNAAQAGLMDSHLLNKNNDLDKIVYSLMLYERTPLGNQLRVQTDNYDQPLDINEGIRLDLGSTAKLRTTVLYLQLIDDLYRKYSDLPKAELKVLAFHLRDHLSLWVKEQLLQNPKITLTEILEAALDKRYSSNPGENFYTGGGLHHFNNYNKLDNNRIIAVRDALRHSVNLVFIRLMRDIEYHYLYRPKGIYIRMEQGGEPLRREYLERFADQEAKVYLRRFYVKYQGKQSNELLHLLTQNGPLNSARLATIFRSIFPQGSLAELKKYLQTYIKATRISDEDIVYLYEKYGVDAFNLHDRGYISHIHPLELWLVNYLFNNPGATLNDVYAASTDVRQEVYVWLFKTRHKNSMDKRIQTLLEREVFSQIAAAWHRVGYQFTDMTSSYASAIGASGDRPSSLAKLMGILLNDGVSYPVTKFENYHFAKDTPFETQMNIQPPKGEAVLSPEVAAAARQALMGVVSGGTAVRLKDVYKDQTGKPLLIGGKTGTGDHIRRMFNARGGQISAQVISRTATFVFFLGNRHFGVLTAYVNGADAAQYTFTSALPVQVLKSLQPLLQPLLVTNGAPEKNQSEPDGADALTKFCCRRDSNALELPYVWWQDLLTAVTQ